MQMADMEIQHSRFAGGEEDDGELSSGLGSKWFTYMIWTIQTWAYLHDINQSELGLLTYEPIRIGYTYMIWTNQNWVYLRDIN